MVGTQGAHPPTQRKERDGNAIDHVIVHRNDVKKRPAPTAQGKVKKKISPVGQANQRDCCSKGPLLQGHQ